MGAASVLVFAGLGCGATTRDKPNTEWDSGDTGSGGGASAGAAGGPAVGGSSGQGGGGKASGGKASGGKASGGKASGGAAGEPNETGPCEPSGPSAPVPGDPGVAGTIYGPIMGGSVSTGARVIQLVGTAAAVGVANGSHLFFTTKPPDEAPVVYLSIVIADREWPTGLYTKPLTGALAVTTRDNCSYRLDLTTVPAGTTAFRLEVTDSSPQGDDFYLRGRLDAQLPSLNGRTPMALHMTIN